MGMDVRVPVFARMRMLMRVRVGMIVGMFRMRVLMVLIMRGLCCLLRCNNVHLCAANACAAHFARFEPCTHIKAGCHLLKVFKGDSRIHQRAQQHVAADARKTFQISNSHRGRFYGISGVGG